MSISKGFLATAKRAIKLDANTYQYFSRNPRGGAKRPLDLDDINAYLEFGHENGFATLLCHAPYTLNAPYHYITERLRLQEEYLKRI